MSGATAFRVVDKGSGRVALKAPKGFVSVEEDGTVSLRSHAPEQSTTFQWMETFDGELILMSLATNRFLRVESSSGEVVADSLGPRPDGRDGVRFHWTVQ